LVFANKQDLQFALEAEEVKNSMFIRNIIGYEYINIDGDLG
jgi:signal recognition particle receptor subunit beta